MFLVNKPAPLKYKYIRANQGPFMNESLRKAIMTRSKMKNHYFQDKCVNSYNEEDTA